MTFQLFDEDPFRDLAFTINTHSVLKSFVIPPISQAKPKWPLRHKLFFLFKLSSCYIPFVIFEIIFDQEVLLFKFVTLFIIFQNSTLVPCDCRFIDACCRLIISYVSKKISLVPFFILPNIYLLKSQCSFLGFYFRQILKIHCSVFFHLMH